MKAKRLYFMPAVVVLMCVAGWVSGTFAQTEGGGRVGGQGTDSTFKPKVRAVAKRTVPKRTTRPGKTAAQYEADGNKFWDAKDYDSALVAYQSAVALKPGYYMFYRIGWIHNDFAEYDKAVSTLYKSINLNSKYAPAYLEIGYSYRKLKRNAEAIAALKNCIAIDPQSSGGHYELGRIYFDQDQFKAAADMLTTATSIKSDYVDAWDLLGMALRKLGRNEEAIEALQKSIDLSPTESNSYMGLGDVYYYGLKDYPKAINAYMKGLQYDDKNSVAAYNIGWASNDLGNFDQALTYLDMATRSNPDYVEAFNEMGFAYMKLQRYSEAESALERAVAINQKDAIAHYYLGQVYNTTNNRTAALAEYRLLKQLGSEYADKLYKMINH